MMNQILASMSDPPTTQIFRSNKMLTKLLLAGAVCLVATPSHLAAQGQLNPDVLVTNATQTPIEGVGHDYLHDMSETVNPQNGQVSIRIAGPSPHERGPNFPHYSYMYDTSGREALRWSPELVQCEQNPPGVGNIMCDAWVVGPGSSNYALNQFNPNSLNGISGPNPTILNSMYKVFVNQTFTNPQIPGGVNNNAGQYHCNYTAYTYFDSQGGLHDFDLPPDFRTSPSMISDEGKGKGYVKEQSHGSADDWSAETTGGGAQSGGRSAGGRGVEAHDLRLESEVRRDGRE